MIFFNLYVTTHKTHNKMRMLMLLLYFLFKLYVFVCLSLLLISSVVFVIFFIIDIIKWSCIYYWNHAHLHSVMYKMIQIIDTHNKKHPGRQIHHTLWYIDNYIPYNTIQEIKHIYRSNGDFRTLCIQHGINERISQLISQLNDNINTTTHNLITQYKNTRTIQHTHLIKQLDHRSVD